jgi:hypothetical protein
LYFIYKFLLHFRFFFIFKFLLHFQVFATLSSFYFIFKFLFHFQVFVLFSSFCFIFKCLHLLLLCKNFLPLIFMCWNLFGKSICKSSWMNQQRANVIKSSILKFWINFSIKKFSFWSWQKLGYILWILYEIIL